MMFMMRRVLAVLSTAGLAASVTVYLGSYFGMTMDSIFREALVLHICVFVLLFSVYRSTGGWVKNYASFWQRYSQGVPRWIGPAVKLLAVFFAIHFCLFLIQSHAASPQIKDGQYVLDNHGQILKVLTPQEYFRLKGAELRLFATGWLFFYFVPTAYWWFSRPVNPLLTDPSPDARAS
jgi:hypothetical protein